MFVDPEFHFLEEKVLSTAVNTTGARDYTLELERQIQVIKEKMQAHHANLPLPGFTRRTIMQLAKHVVMFLNAFTPKSDLSKTYSPHTIMTGKAFDCNKIWKIHFGAYTQVHKNRNITNTLEDRTQRAICLGPTCNLQGTCNLFSIQYGNNITCVQFTEVPTPTIVMKPVVAMALAKKQNEKQFKKNALAPW